MDPKSASPLQSKQCDLLEEGENLISQTCELSQEENRALLHRENSASDCSLNANIVQKSSNSSSGSISDLEGKDEDDSSYNASSPEEVDETSDDANIDDDCVIIKVIQKTKQKSRVNAIEQKNSKETPPIYCDIVHPDIKVPNKNKTYNFPLPRRNPKRLAKQLNCRKLKLESRFYYTYPPTKQAKKTISEKFLGSNNQRSSRSAKRPQKLDDVILDNTSSQQDIPKDVCGLISKKKMRTKSRLIDASEYEPPSPETQWVWREWPAEGMHERPVWPDPRYETEHCSPMQEISHHALHAVLGFCAYVCSKTEVPTANEKSSISDNSLKFCSGDNNSNNNNNNNNEANMCDENVKLNFNNLEPHDEQKSTHNPSNFLGENKYDFSNFNTEPLIIENSSMKSNKDRKEVYDLPLPTSSEAIISSVDDLCCQKLPTEEKVSDNCFDKEDLLNIQEIKKSESNIEKSVDSFIGKTEEDIKHDQGVADSEDKNDVSDVITFEGLRDLVNYTALLYCIVCSVPQENVANYINSMDAVKAMEWLEDIV